MTARKTPNEVAQALAAYLDASSRSRVAFNWRDRNCCHFAAGWVLEATGRDVLAGLGVTPDGRAALRLVRAMGGSLEQAWTRQLGIAPVLPLFARVGDVVLLPTSPLLVGLGAAVGVCAGAQVACIDALGSTLFVPLSHGLRCWHLDQVQPAGAAAQVAP